MWRIPGLNQIAIDDKMHRKWTLQLERQTTKQGLLELEEELNISQMWREDVDIDLNLYRKMLCTIKTEKMKIANKHVALIIMNINKNIDLRIIQDYALTTRCTDE